MKNDVLVRVLVEIQFIIAAIVELFARTCVAPQISKMPSFACAIFVSTSSSTFSSLKVGGRFLM